MIIKYISIEMVKEQQKDLYVSPEVTTLEIKEQAIICQSGSNEDYDNTNDPDWFN